MCHLLKRLLVVSAILHNAQGEVLLQLRDERPGLEFAGHWTLPGGHVEAGESPEAAIRRELMEEMFLDIPLEFLRDYPARRGPLNLVRVWQVLYTGEVRQPAESIPLTEGQALRFFGPAEIDSLPLAFGFRPVLRAYFLDKERKQT